MAVSLADQLDDLLAQYLQFIDIYQKHRLELSETFSSGFLSLAQANFKAPSGVRYGQDMYDERMKTVLRVDVLLGDNPTFHISEIPIPPATVNQDPAKEAAGSEKTPEREEEEVEDEANSPLRDPLKMFGILVPAALRTAQRNFKKGVMEQVGTLVQIDKALRAQENSIAAVRKKIKEGGSRGEIPHNVVTWGT